MAIAVLDGIDLSSLHTMWFRSRLLQKTLVMYRQTK